VRKDRSIGGRDRGERQRIGGGARCDGKDAHFGAEKFAKHLIEPARPAVVPVGVLKPAIGRNDRVQDLGTCAAGLSLRKRISQGASGTTMRQRRGTQAPSIQDTQVGRHLRNARAVDGHGAGGV